MHTIGRDEQTSLISHRSTMQSCRTNARDERRSKFKIALTPFIASEDLNLAPEEEEHTK